MVSHRGAAGLAPENTLASINAAINQGAKYIEFDVQRSADGVLLLMHDLRLSRTTPSEGFVNEMTWAKLQSTDAGSHFSPQFVSETIPSLKQVLEATSNYEGILVIELKNPNLYPGIEEQVLREIQIYSVSQKIIVVSFDYISLRRILEYSPKTPIGLLSIYPYDLPHLQDRQIVAVHWLSVLLDPTLVYRLHAADYQVWAWTVNSPQLFDVIKNLQVQAIVTDRPDLWNHAASGR